MPGVGIGIMIFNEEGKILLLLRNHDQIKADSMMRLEGTWTLPAGKVKINENLKQAAIRKAKEETNLDINGIRVISVADDINEYAHFVTIGVLAIGYSGQIDLGNSEEQVEYGFYNLNELPDSLCEPSRKIINNYKNNTIYQEGED